MSDENQVQVSMSLNGEAPVNLGSLKNLEKVAARAKKGAIPVELRDSKLFKAVVKETDKEHAAAILEKTDDELKMILAENILRREDLKSKLESNIEYMKAKDVVETLEGGLKSTMKGSDACAKLAKAVLKSRKG
jgi:hypothetical protein